MSNRDPADIWAWIYEDEERLEEAGGAKPAIVHNWRHFWHHYHSDAAAANQAIHAALETARAEGELRWELLLRHWRLQLWLNHDLNKVLPEAIDLLSLATDERVRDVPQRICAFHDLVDCHVQMDAAGYYEDIVANAQDVLAQLPASHPCASCARLNLIQAAGAAGRAQEAESWIAQFLAHLHRPKSTYVESTIALAKTYEALGRWADAEREYREAAEDARKEEEINSYIEALLGLARVRLHTAGVEAALMTLRQARHFAKYERGAYLVARLLETEGYVAEAYGELAVALDYFTEATRQLLNLGRLRHAALTGLHAAEMARAAGLEPIEAVLALVAEAVEKMPPASRDVAQRLERLGGAPRSPRVQDPGDGPASLGEEVPGAASLEAGELGALEGALNSHLKSGNVRGAAVAFYRLGSWYVSHQQPRAALDYLIANAVLERLLCLPMSDREDALGALQHLREALPAGTVKAALAAAEQNPSPLLTPLLGEMSRARWQWLVRSVAAELEDKPVVDPEPEGESAEERFQNWLEHVASMTALILRFRGQADQAMCERWATQLDETAGEMQAQVAPDGQGRELVTLAYGLAALARGGAPEEVARQVLPPFDEVIAQIAAVAEEPVWNHPGSSPLEFLVEHAAQRSVRALRIHDEYRAPRLANLAWRFELMSLDLEKAEQLQPIQRFLHALCQFLRADGQTLPALDLPLEQPFDAILQAVYEASRSTVH